MRISYIYEGFQEAMRKVKTQETGLTTERVEIGEDMILMR